MKIKMFMLITALIILSSCDKIKEGTVIKTSYEPSRHYTRTVSHHHRVGKTSFITYSIVHMYDDEDFLIEIEGYNKKHKLQDRWIYITKEMYDTIKVGDYYCIDNMCHVDDYDTKE